MVAPVPWIYMIIWGFREPEVGFNGICEMTIICFGEICTQLSEVGHPANPGWDRDQHLLMC